jgi:hypothetical protein
MKESQFLSGAGASANRFCCRQAGRSARSTFQLQERPDFILASLHVSNNSDPK